MMRFASPNEMRTIVREDLGFYHSVLVGGVYEFEEAEDGLFNPAFFIGPLKCCIDKHATLTVIVKDKHTEKAYYEQVPTMDLSAHLEVCQALLVSPQSTLVFLHLPALENGSTAASCFGQLMPEPLALTFAFSHALGDGISGLAFHRTLLEALRQPIDAESSLSMLHNTMPGRELAAPFDTPERLPISWGYLMGPLLGALLPVWLGELFGLKASVASPDAGTWTGPPMFLHPSDPAATRIRLLEIDSADVDKALRIARRHGAKLTAVMHQLIIRALDKAVPDPAVTNWLSNTAINMRPAIGASHDEMGLFVTVCIQSHARVPGSSPLSEADWAAARELTKKLALGATVTQDQPIGLLRYVPNMRKWTAGKIGQRRDGSYDVSNLGAFADVKADSQNPLLKRCALAKMAFSHSTSPIAEPLVLSTVSVRGGSLMISVGWTPGSLGVPEASELEFVNGFCASLREGFRTLE